MTTERDRFGDVVAYGFPRDERREQHRELGFARASELVGTGIEDEVREWLTESGFGLIDHAPRRVVAPRRAHRGPLRSLPWEHDRNTHRLPAALRHPVLVPTRPPRAGLHNQQHLPTSNRYFAVLTGNAGSQCRPPAVGEASRSTVRRWRCPTPTTSSRCSHTARRSASSTWSTSSIPAARWSPATA